MSRAPSGRGPAAASRQGRQPRPSVVRSGQGPKAKHHAGIWTCTAGPGSAPSASLSPSLFLLPLPSVFEVKVKRAHVPDLSDIISCSGRLLGINKINLTIENKTERGERKREKEKRGPKPLGVREVRWGWACGFPGAFAHSFARKMPAQTWEGTGPGLARRPDSSGSGVMGEGGGLQVEGPAAKPSLTRLCRG